MKTEQEIWRDLEDMFYFRNGANRPAFVEIQQRKKIHIQGRWIFAQSNDRQ